MTIVGAEARGALDGLARRTVEQSTCPLCDIEPGPTDPAGLMAHLAIDHKLAGRAVCACGKDYRTEGYHRSHVAGVRDVRGDASAANHLVVLPCDYQATSRPPRPARRLTPVTRPSAARRSPTPFDTKAVRRRPPAVWVSSSAPARTMTGEERDRLTEAQRRRAFEIE